MTYLGSTGCSGTLHPPRPAAAHAAAAFHRGKSPSIPPTRHCHNPPPTLATCVDVCPCECVCVSPLFFPDIPVRSREALDSATGRQDLRLHPESHWKKAAILSERDFCCSSLSPSHLAVAFLDRDVTILGTSACMRRRNFQESISLHPVTFVETLKKHLAVFCLLIQLYFW